MFAGGILEPGDVRARAVHDALLVLLEAVVALELDATRQYENFVQKFVQIC
jgi:hypothetical protein